MSSRIRAFDWASTPVGPINQWPHALKIAVGMMLHSAFPKCIVWGPSLITIYNDAFKPILGEKPEALGRSFNDVWSEVWDSVGPIAERALLGESTFIEDFALLIDRRGFPEQCYFTFCYSPIPDETGNVCGFLDTVIETTAKVEAERLAAVRNEELAHRIRNSAALMSAITRQTLKNSSSIEDATRVVSQRIQALARTHDILTVTGQPLAMVHDIVNSALEPHFSSERFTTSGPSYKLPERQALALALAVNELATNATKHGALSTDQGRVAISWHIEKSTDDGRVFKFVWAEQDGPPCAPATRKSFGTQLLENIVPADFRGQANVLYLTTGFRYELIAGLDRFETEQ